MLNTRSVNESVYKRKPDLAPYIGQQRTPDWRQDDQLNNTLVSCYNYYSGESVKKREKYTAAEKAQLKKGTRKNFTTGERHKMCLSQETLEGLRMTGIIIASYKVLFFVHHAANSFVQMARYLLRLPGTMFSPVREILSGPTRVIFWPAEISRGPQ